jgi:hypothetical protein
MTGKWAPAARSSLALPPIFLFSLLAGCGNATEKSACDGLADRSLGITREEYRPCAGEIMAVLDTLGPQVEAVLEGDTAALPQARASSRRLASLVRRTGIESDYTSMRPGTEVERWPENDLRAFNSYMYDAYFNYRTFLVDRTRERFDEGRKHHERASSLYRSLE